MSPVAEVLSAVYRDRVVREVTGTGSDTRVAFVTPRPEVAEVDAIVVAEVVIDSCAHLVGV